MRKKITSWEVPSYLKENWKDVSPELVKEVFSQAEKMLIELVKAGESVTVKAFKVLQLSVLVMTVSLGYVLTENTECVLLLAAKISSGLSFASIIVLAIPIWAYSTYVIGSSPSKMLNDSNLLKASDQVKTLLFSELYSYEKRINYNLTKNVKRTILVNVAMILLILVPISLFAFWLILMWIDL
ncbi:hypothetical protein [Ekhidna sp.]|uniref:hypothetical protein n=1 Tax=Ekhidna sp. TaxID=2608089 RepID=UPI003298328F